MSDYTRKAMAEARNQMHNYRSPILAQSDAGPGMTAENESPGPQDKTDKWDREHVKSRVILQDESGRFEAIDKAALADRSVRGELIPDCPTEGVAARQGNGG